LAKPVKKQTKSKNNAKRRLKPLLFVIFFFAFVLSQPAASKDVPVETTMLNDDTLQAVFELPCSFERLWETITNYENSPNVMPNIKKATVISSQHGGKANIDYVASVAGAGPFSISYTTKITSIKSDGLITWEQTEGSFTKNYGSWRLTALSKKLTKVVYTVTLSHKYMPNSIKNMLTRRSVPDLYESLKKNTQD
jgi:ribosome-associated toxin RatA of RatAB toxin-antitoxin module